MRCWFIIFLCTSSMSFNYSTFTIKIKLWLSSINLKIHTKQHSLRHFWIFVMKIISGWRQTDTIGQNIPVADSVTLNSPRRLVTTYSLWKSLSRWAKPVTTVLSTLPIVTDLIAYPLTEFQKLFTWRTVWCLDQLLRFILCIQFKAILKITVNFFCRYVLTIR